MKLKTMVSAIAMTLVMSVSAFAAETAKVIANDGSSMESGNYTAFSVSNVEKQSKNEYGWGVFDAAAPVSIKDISSMTEELYVMKFADFEAYFLNDYVHEEMNKASLSTVNGEIKITEAGKYGVFYTNGAFEYMYIINVSAPAPAPVKPVVPVTPAVQPAKTAKAVPTDSKVLVNGMAVAFDAYNIDGNNYFKLRDVAKVVSGSEKQFAVTWDGSKKSINLVSGEAYEATGTELAKGDGKTKTATLNTSVIYKDGEVAVMTAYTINGNNYFKLRDLGRAFDFNVGWDGLNNCITISTAESYTE